jgi:hypothetical protein
MTPDDVVVISIAGLAGTLFTLSTVYYTAVELRWVGVRARVNPKATIGAPDGVRFPQFFL